MRKIIILLLCCGVFMSMVGCGDNAAPPPIESLLTTVSETTITEVPTETIPPITAVEPTEKEKEPTPTESKDQATEPTVTATEPLSAPPKEETKPTEITRPTEPSAAENTEESGCITIVETEDPPTEEIIIPPKPCSTANMWTGRYTVWKARKIIIPPMCVKPSAKVTGRMSAVLNTPTWLLELLRTQAKRSAWTQMVGGGL